MEDIIVSDASGWPLELCLLPMICMVKDPDDYPNKYVARLLDTGTATDYMGVADTLEELRLLVPKDMRCFPRQLEDNPIVVECWF